MIKEAVLVVDKPAGPTSFDIVRQVKRLVENGTKVGHAGSLDPFATGALVLLLGKATKLSGALLNADKKYTGKIRLGATTDTLDLTGEVTEEKPIPALTLDQVNTVLKSFEGEWEQTAPMYSAKKIHGVRFYELARQNIKVRRAPIPVQLFSLDLVSFSGEELEFDVHCSKGTYVRSLADDIARRLDTVGHLVSLRRKTCGPFHLGESFSLEQLKESFPEAMKAGYSNYIKLLRSEGLRRPAVRPERQHLQMAETSGNSLLN